MKSPERVSTATDHASKIRKERKSEKERQRRQALNILYDELGSLLFGNKQHEYKDRVSILQATVEHLSKINHYRLQRNLVIQNQNINLQNIHPMNVSQFNQNLKISNEKQESVSLKKTETESEAAQSLIMLHQI